MKKLAAFLTFAFIITLTTKATAQNFSGLDKSPMDMAAFPSDYKMSDKVVRIIYGRPQLKGRSLAELAPAGQVWRTGANEAPEITFYQDMDFGGEPVKAGTYSLFTIPGQDEWTVVLNKNLNQWGSYFYDEADDVLRVKLPKKSDSKGLEEFSIAFTDADGGTDMIMGWDTARVSVPLRW